MTCIVCHRSVATRAKKCSACGAPTALSKGDFLFEMNSADEKQLKTYYKKMQEAKETSQNTSNESSTLVQTSGSKETGSQPSAWSYTPIPKVDTSKHRISLGNAVYSLILSLFTGLCVTFAVLSYVGVFQDGRFMTIVFENTAWVWLMIASWILAIPSIWFTVKKMIRLADSGLYQRGILIWGMVGVIVISAIIVLVLYFRLPTLEEYEIEKYGYHI